MRNERARPRVPRSGPPTCPIDPAIAAACERDPPHPRSPLAVAPLRPAPKSSMRRVHARTPPRMHRSPRRSPAAGRPTGPRPVVRWSSWDRLSSARRTTAALLPRPSIPRAKWHGPSRALSRRFRRPGGTVVDAVAGALSGSTELCSPPSTACSAAGTRSREGLAVRTHGRLRARRQHQEVPPRRGLDGRSARAGGCAADPPAGPPGRQDHVEVAVRGSPPTCAGSSCHNAHRSAR